MASKRRLYLFAFQFPLTLLIGILLYFAYSMRVHEQPRIDWIVAVALALIIDVALTLLNKRDEKRHQSPTL